MSGHNQFAQMNNAEHIESLNTLAEVAKQREKPTKRARLASVRVSPGAYLAAASVLTFASALLIRTEQDLFALGALAIAWMLLPVLALTDRVEFDGQSLSRRGPVPFVQRLISGRRKQLNVTEFEKVDTHALRTLRRRGRVRYRYRTQIVGKGAEFVFASGGRRYREMAQHLFPMIDPAKLDLRTLELRDYLCEPVTLNKEIEVLQLGSADMLNDAGMEFKLGGKKRPQAGDCEKATTVTMHVDPERAALLGSLGNKLRVAGRFTEAREAFRRALTAVPTDARLIFDFARLLRSQAGSMSDAKLLSRSRAALRLSARRAGDQPDLLALVGESFLEWGETTRAQNSFQKAIELDPANFRARMGLASLALREGKLAHVIHQYRDAARAGLEKALANYARREADYYARLNDDDDYLVSELRRINWLQHALRVRRLAARVTNVSILAALIAPYVDESLVGICWSLASSSLVAWILSLFGIQVLSKRRAPQAIN
jgi:tetratricopeptide (TPR) repeat protein